MEKQGIGVASRVLAREVGGDEVPRTDVGVRGSRRVLSGTCWSVTRWVPDPQPPPAKCFSCRK